MDERVVIESERGMDEPNNTSRAGTYDTQRERLTLEDEKDDLKFEGATFPAFIQGKKVGYNAAGDIEMTLVIPAKERHMFGTLGAAMRQPLLVTIIPWRNRNAE